MDPITDFKPMLGCELDNLEDIKFPKFVSHKLDGIRCIFHPKLGMISRSLKQIPNKQLQEKFRHITEYSEKHNVILDGELYNHYLTFQQITSLVMTKDFEDINKVNKNLKDKEFNFVNLYHNKKDEKGFYFNNPLEFHCFDLLELDDISKTFAHRLLDRRDLELNGLIKVENHQIETLVELKELFENKLKEGYEGLIMRNINSKYKFGRATPLSQDLLKYKPWRTYDAKIIDIVQEQMSTAESTKNELGHSEKSHKKEFMVPINRASAFLVNYNGNELKVSIALTHKEREEIYLNRSSYRGKWIEFKGMDVGAKNVPRHPVTLRFRHDKDML